MVEGENGQGVDDDSPEAIALRIVEDADVAGNCDVLLNDIETALRAERAEVERLRAALERIVTNGASALDVRIARAALAAPASPVEKSDS